MSVKGIGPKVFRYDHSQRPSREYLINLLLRHLIITGGQLPTHTEARKILGQFADRWIEGEFGRWEVYFTLTRQAWQSGQRPQVNVTKYSPEPIRPPHISTAKKPVAVAQRKMPTTITGVVAVIEDIGIKVESRAEQFFIAAVLGLNDVSQPLPTWSEWKDYFSVMGSKLPDQLTVLMMPFGIMKEYGHFVRITYSVKEQEIGRVIDTVQITDSEFLEDLVDISPEDGVGVIWLARSRQRYEWLGAVGDGSEDLEGWEIQKNIGSIGGAVFAPDYDRLERDRKKLSRLLGVTGYGTSGEICRIDPLTTPSDVQLVRPIEKLPVELPNTMQGTPHVEIPWEDIATPPSILIPSPREESHEGGGAVVLSIILSGVFFYLMRGMPFPRTFLGSGGITIDPEVI